MRHIPTGKWDDSTLIVTVPANLFVKVSSHTAAFSNLDVLSADLGSAQEVR
jgi:hypothetical protein